MLLHYVASHVADLIFFWEAFWLQRKIIKLQEFDFMSNSWLITAVTTVPQVVLICCNSQISWQTKKDVWAKGRPVINFHSGYTTVFPRSKLLHKPWGAFKVWEDLPWWRWGKVFFGVTRGERTYWLQMIWLKIFIMMTLFKFMLTCAITSRLLELAGMWITKATFPAVAESLRSNLRVST